MLCAAMDGPHEMQAGWLSCHHSPHQHPGSQHTGTRMSPRSGSHRAPPQGTAVLNTLCSAEAPCQVSNGMQRDSMWPPP